MQNSYCLESGEIWDDAFRDYNYLNGIPIKKCRRCGAKRRLRKVWRSLGRRGSGCGDYMLIYPYHHTVAAANGEIRP